MEEQTVPVDEDEGLAEEEKHAHEETSQQSDINLS